MYISAFHIDGFGIFANVDCASLSPGLNIFFGKNEAGKSTCLEFFRCMLTGYPPKGSRKGHQAEPRGGAHPGGSLILQCEEKPHELRLSRSPEAHGGLRLYAADGSSLSGDMLAKILSGIDREIYSRIFGFSLTELEQWDKASEESIRNALYGASFGPGLVSPAEAEKSLQKRMGAIFKSRGTNQPLVEANRELKKIQAEIAALQEKRSGYDALAMRLANTTHELAQIRNEQMELANEARRLERRLGQWHNQDLLRSQKLRLAGIERVPDGFPEDAVRRLANLQENCSRAEQNLASARAKLEQLEQRRADLQVNTALLMELGELRSLAERKSSYRHAAAQIRPLNELCGTLRERLAEDLAQLGPDWTCERIRKTDRSLFARDGVDRLANALNEALVNHNTCSARLLEANTSVERLNRRNADLTREIEDLPLVQAMLDDNEREELRRNRARLEECRRAEPGRERAWENAKQAFERALTQAHVFSNPDGEAAENRASLMNAMLAHQDEAHDLAGRIADCLKDLEKAEASEQAAVKDAEEIKARLDGEINEQRALGGQTREALEAKKKSLTQLRELLSRLGMETEHRNELESRIAQVRQLAPVRNWILIVFSLLLLAGAAAIFSAHWLLGMQEIVLGEGIVVPVNLWAGYAALFCGVILFAAGFSSNGPEQKRRKLELASMLARSETYAIQIGELEAQTGRLGQELELASTDPYSLEMLEVLLDREKEQLVQEETARRKISQLEQERKRADQRIAGLREETQARESEVQQLRRRWHGLMQGLGIVNVPSPESIGTVFARIENAKNAEINVANAQKELDALWEDLHVLEDQITSMPVIKKILESAPEPIGLEEAVQTALNNCSEADKVLAKRTNLSLELDRLQSQIDDAAEQQQNAEAELRKSAAALAEARENWQARVEGLGLAQDMTPDTVRQAFDYMQTCLADEENLKRAERDLAHCQEEMTALEKPLGALAARAGAEPLATADGGANWLGTLDALLGEAEANDRREQRRAAISEDIAAQKDDLAAIEAGASACEASISSLIGQSGAEDTNHFLRLAKARDERREAMSRIKELELALTQAAGDEPLERFLSSFEATDRDSHEARLGEIAEKQKELTERERTRTADEAILTRDLRELEAATDLGELRQKEEALKEEITGLATSWCELALADALLKEAKSNFEKERQPEIIKSASEIFREITDGRWTGINLHLDGGNLTMMPAHGEPVAPEMLSRGGQEQAWLAMRLAYIKKHNTSGEPLPLIMDEVLVNFDPERARRSAQAFARLSEDGRQQLLYFTCQPHMVDMLQEVFKEPALYEVANGQIKAA